MLDRKAFLPLTKQDMIDRKIEQFDFICITGDSYVDHPSFGIAIISRVVESLGFTVGIIAQPQSDKDYTIYGRPKYAFLVTSGNIDSMVAHYTAAKKRRSDDAYSAGGKTGKRPDRALVVYCNALRRIYGDVAIAVGGLEASLRRFAHYDYWADKVLPSILVDSKADLLMYGMGERSVSEIVLRLSKGENIKDLRDIRGTCYLVDTKETPIGAKECPSFEQVSTSKPHYAKACKLQYDWQDEKYGKTLLQRHGDKMLVQNPPAISLTTEEMDKVYALPYARAYHIDYEKLGGVPGIEEVEFSITHNRGCFGNCNFCSIALHQGRKISVRSHDSVIAEAIKLTKMPNFKGYIHDVGGPTANFRHNSCKAQDKNGLCMGKKCLAPTPCKALDADQSDFVSLLRKLRNIKGVKRVFIRSGIRFDYLLCDKDDTFFKELVEHHVSGQLKVAPEHCSANTLDMMGKPHIETYKKFSEKFYKYTKQCGKEQYLVPYLMSSHPGCTLKDAIELALFLKENRIRPEQVQDFYPTPGTISTCMYYTELNPYTMEKIYVPKTAEDKAMQRALLQYFNPKNYSLVAKALKIANRRDLIGNNPKCLIKPMNDTNANGANNQWKNKQKKSSNRQQKSYRKTK